MARRRRFLQPAFALLLVTLAGAGPALALTVTVGLPPDGANFAVSTVALNGTASGPTLATMRLDGAAFFGNGTFNRTALMASGAVGVSLPNDTTVRFFDAFNYVNNTDPTTVNPMWVGQNLSQNLSASAWRASNASTNPLPGQAALRVNAANPGSSLYFHTVTPSPITRAYIEFQYAIASPGRFEVFVSQDAASNGTRVYTGLTALSATSIGFDITSPVRNGTSIFVRLFASAGGAVVVDDFAAEVSFRGSGTSTASGFADNFSNVTRSPVWWDVRNVWRLTPSGPSPNGPSLTHAANAQANSSNMTFGLRTATALQSARLRFNYTCQENGTFRAFVAPGAGQLGTQVVDAPGLVPWTLYDADISPYLGTSTLWLRFVGGVLASTTNVCAVDDFRLTFQIAGNASGIARGDYMSPVIDPGAPAAWNVTWSYFEIPGAGGRWFEMRSEVSPGIWNPWVRVANGGIFPYGTTRLVQFRASMWAPLSAGLANLTGVELRHYLMRGVQITADGWNTSINASVTYPSGPLSINWSANLTLQPGLNNLTIRAFDSGGVFVDTQRSYFWDIYPPTVPGTPTAGTALTNQSTINWSWAPAADLGFGIADYRVNLGSSPGAADILSNTSAGASPWFAYTAALSGRTYYLSVKARDGAGLWSPWSNSSSAVMADLAGPQPFVPTASGAWVNTSAITWTWAPFDEDVSGIESYFVRVGTSPGWLDLVNGLPVANTSFTFAGAAHGGTYYCSVRARDIAQNYGPWSASSAAVRVDLAAPPAPASPIGPSGFANLSRGTWSWNAVADNGSGVAGYEVVIGSTPQGEDLLPPFTVPGTSYAVSGIPDGAQVFVRARARDAAGNVGPWSLPSEALTVDRTPPGPMVFTRSPPRWNTPGILTWNWSAAKESGSGLATYLVRLGAVPGGESMVRDTRLNATTYARPGVEEAYPAYLTVRAIDRAGNEGPSVVSEPSQVDSTKPRPPSAVLEPESPAGSPSLTWTWPPSSDVGSGLAGYEVQVGTSAGGSDALPWTPTPVASFTFTGTVSRTRYFFAVRAVDLVGWRSDFVLGGGGVYVDLEAPSAVNLTIEASITRSPRATVNWSFAEDFGGSHLVKYQVGVTNGSTVTFENFSATDASFDLAGDDGASYTVRVRALDGAGNAAPWSLPVTLLFDRTPPTMPGSIMRLSVPGGIEFTWTASEDGGSGLAGYYVDVGTRPGVADVASHVLVNGTRYTTPAAKGGSLFITVTATDQAGNTAAARGPADADVQQAGAPGFEAAVAAAAIAACVLARRVRQRRG